jgi:hypothetical protein
MWYYGLYTIETVTNETLFEGTININLDRTTLLGRDSWFIMLFMFVFLTAVGAAHPVLGIIFGFMGLMLTIFIGIVPLNSVTAIISIVAVMGGVLIWRLRT